MNTRSPGSSSGGGGGSGYPSKRVRHSPPDVKSPVESYDAPVAAGEPLLPDELGEPQSGGKAGQSSSFRNVSACNRCRLRKNRCDQRLPSCASCDKASVRCVGYDPITKREIPRSYVFYLESRVNYLETLLQTQNIPFAPAEALDSGSRPGMDPNAILSPVAEDGPHYNGYDSNNGAVQKAQSQKEDGRSKRHDESEKLDKLVSNIGMVSVQGASDPRYLGSTSGISFARVVFAAVKSSVSNSNSEKAGIRPSKPISAKVAGPGGTSMRDSFFGLQTKPTIKQAPFPDRSIGLRLVNFYFEHANPQIPVLHRGEFMKLFEQAYAEKDRVRTPRELYMLNIVFAIGAGIFLGDSDSDSESSKTSSTVQRGKPYMQQCQPEEYHASAIVHLESLLSSTSVVERPDGFGGGLEELQAVLLLAGFALLRPVAPGLWYIIGVAVRLAVDLGLHYEDGKDIHEGLESSTSRDSKAEDNDLDRQRDENSAKETGRREWIRDFRRRLWWCTYSFDRLVSTCVGRPFGITDQVITTEFPSLLEDRYITPGGLLKPKGGPSEPTYKHVAYHYFRLRLLQSEILQVLQHQQAQIVRAGGTNEPNPFMHTDLPSPFLSKFDSFRSWRIDIDKRLLQWKESSPTKAETGVAFSTEFLDLNYWQAIIMLYRQSLSVPPLFEGEFNTSEEVESPSAHTVELREDEERVFLKVAEAGQRVLRLYRQLHRVHLVNYTFLATHHLFMAGISFLYAIWHSPIVRSRLTMDEVDFTILAATSVLGDLIEKCPPAEACRDAFDRMSKATVQMCMSTTGFSSSAQGLYSEPNRSQNRSEDHSSTDYYKGASRTQFVTSNARSQSSSAQQQRSSMDHRKKSTRPKPQFDMGLNDLFPAPTAGQNHIEGVGIQSSYQNPSSKSNSSRTIKDEYTNTSDTYSMPRSQASTPSNYVSPTLDHSAIDPSLLPSPQGVMQPSYVSQDSSLNVFGNAYGDMDWSLQGMDFLQGGGLGNTTSTTAEGQGGLDLGFGLGWEGMDHDFSEGNQLDLFEGFFFGN